MEFRARLVHADTRGRVVQVRAFEGQRCLGSALGEASTAEEAEDRASDRLRQRLGANASVSFGESPASRGQASDPSLPAPRREPASGPVHAVATPLEATPLGGTLAEEGKGPQDHPPLKEKNAPQPVEPSPDPEPPPDPEDWSADLIRLDRLLVSLGWGREQERIFMQRLFGHPSRSRLTRYADLMLLRRALEALSPGIAPDSAPLPLLRADLLAQCDDLLTRLGWTTERARQWLEGQFAVTSRQRLSDDQLLTFNLLLESELLGHSEIGGAGGCLELPQVHSEISPS